MSQPFPFTVQIAIPQILCCRKLKKCVLLPRASFSQFSTEIVHKAVEDLRELPSCLPLSDFHRPWAVRSSIQSKCDAGDD